MCELPTDANAGAAASWDQGLMFGWQSLPVPMPNSRGEVVVVLDNLGVLLVADLAQEDLVHLLLVGGDRLVALGLRLRTPGAKTVVSALPPVSERAPGGSATTQRRAGTFHFLCSSATFSGSSVCSISISSILRDSVTALTWDAGTGVYGTSCQRNAGARERAQREDRGDNRGRRLTSAVLLPSIGVPVVLHPADTGGHLRGTGADKRGQRTQKVLCCRTGGRRLRAPPRLGLAGAIHVP